MPEPTIDLSAPLHDPSRRDCVRARLGSSFAAAAPSVTAQARVKTESWGLSVDGVSISVGDFRMPARRVMPSGNSLSETILYPDTPHAFHADDRPGCRKPTVDDGWRRGPARFKSHGVA